MTTRPVIVMLEEIEMIDTEEMTIEAEIVGEILGEVHLEMMNHTTPMDPPFIVEEVVDVEENATP